INTVRGNREQVRGRSEDLAGPAGRRLLAAGPLLSPDGSDSLSLDEAIEARMAIGRGLEWTVRNLIPAAAETQPDVRHQHGVLEASPLLAPWDGPAAIVFGDGRRVGAVVDRNGLRPAAYAVTRDGIVALASEAGAVPLSAAETTRRGRLGPGEMLVVEPAAGSIRTEARHARRHATARLRQAIRTHRDRPTSTAGDVPPTPGPLRYLVGLDAERARLDIKTMVLEGHEPLWSMGDDTPTPGRARIDRPVADHLRQSFAQVTNPAIDPERERIVMDLTIDLGRRASLLGGRRTARPRGHPARSRGPARRPLACHGAGGRSKRRPSLARDRARPRDGRNSRCRDARAGRGRREPREGLRRRAAKGPRPNGHQH